jgi:hypothetical protein
MRRARRIALLRATGAFHIVHQHETDVLADLAGWITRLWHALISVTEYRSGFGGVGYAQLVVMCAPLQPRSGPRLYAPDAQAIRRAVVALEVRGLLVRDKEHSEAARFLFFRVAPRYVSVRAPSEFEGVTRRGSDTPEKLEPARVSAPSVDETRRANSKGSSTVVHIHEARATRDTPTQRAMRARLKSKTP